MKCVFVTISLKKTGRLQKVFSVVGISSYLCTNKKKQSFFITL